LAGADSDKYASSDSLTGLGDKESFSREFTRCIADKASEHSVFSLIIIDIDHFKSVNDGFGHRRGDQILSEFGRRVLEVSREKDMVFRYGGDEFTGILHRTDLGEATKFSSRLLEKIGGEEFKGSPPLSITLSIGIAQFPVDGSSVRELFDTADRRLYTAKRSGRNRVVSADDPDQLENGDNIPGRLLGREKELASFMLFTEEAGEKGRGFFLVLGPDGAGKGSFLDAAASLLSLNEYKLIKTSGNRTDLQRPHSSIAACLGCEPDGDTVIDALYSYAGSSMSLGVFLEDMHLIDSASIDDVMKFYSVYPGWMVVAASTERNVTNQGSEFEGVSSSIRLGPISQEDCRAWFRAVLMWDPPEDFLEWFYGETGGLPGLFAQGIRHLERRGYLVSTGGSYSVDSDCMNFLLGNRLAFGTTAEINNLPVDLTPFLGRDQELSRIRDLFDTQTRLITLKGISGTGCRRLAIRAAGQNESLFTSGICLVDCAAGLEPVPVRLAAELSLPSGKDPEAGIESFLADAVMLLVFVNVSPGTEVVSFISGLLENCSGITVLATSRNALEINDEVVVPVGGISTARHSEGVPSDAAAVFIQAAERLAGIRFSGDLDLDVVEDICALVDGVPMAIELAASWIRVMSVSSIYRRISANPSFLQGGDEEETADGFSDLLQHSWEQLSSEESNAALRLTVFAGHFTVEEAEEISDVPLEIIMSLVDTSFLLRDDQGIHIPALTSDFIIQEGNPYSRGFEVAREMHCRYFAHRAEFFGEMARTGREAGRGFDGIKESFSDISIAWKFAIEKGRYRFLRQMLGSVFVYCLDRGRFRTGFNMIKEAISNSTLEISPGLTGILLSSQGLLAHRMGRARMSQELMEQALGTTADLSDTDRASVLFIRGKMMVELGQLSSAEDYLDRALKIYTDQEEHLDVLEVELEILKCNLESGNYSIVRSTLPSVAEQCKRYSFWTGEWKTRLYMGNLAAADGDFRRAREAFLSYLSAVKTAGYTGLCAMALNEVAGVEASQGSYGEAEQHYLASAEYYRKIGSIQGQAGIKLNLAVVNQMRGRGEEVRKNYSEALELGEKSQDENIIANSLCGLAFNSIELEETVQAGSLLERAAGIASRSGNKPVLIRALYGLAVLDSMNSNPVRAALTALALLHNKAADSEAEVFCMELIGTLRKDLGEERIEELKQDADTITLSEVLDMYTDTAAGDDDSGYRTT